MNNPFNVEEVNLICIYQSKDRAVVIQGIRGALPHLKDLDMLELAKQVLAKLEHMTDAEFAELEFVPVDDQEAE